VAEVSPQSRERGRTAVREILGSVGAELANSADAMFFALWKHAAVPAAMGELEQVGPAESAAFGRAEESRKRERRMIRMMESLVA
jgi:hypothetical protein